MKRSLLLIVLFAIVLEAALLGYLILEYSLQSYLPDIEVDTFIQFLRENPPFLYMIVFAFIALLVIFIALNYK